jgi:HK97 family phage major capsid protein
MRFKHGISLGRYLTAVLSPAIALASFLGLVGIGPLGFTPDGGDGGGAPLGVLDRLKAKRDAALTAARALVTGAEAEDRDLTDDELAKIKEHRSDVDKRDGQIAELEQLEQRQARANQAGSMSQPGQPLAAASAPHVQVTRNESTYRPGGETSFLRDIYSAQRGDYAAAERLQRNNKEQGEIEQRRFAEARAKSSALGAEFAGESIPELRDGTTGSTSMGSFIPPVWLVDEFAAKARVGRVLAPFMRDGGFPTTNSITIPRATTGSSVAGQAGDNAGVSETDIVTSQLTRSTVTIAGQQDVSIQSLDLSPYPVDQIIFADLEAAYQAELDRQIMRGSGTNELLGIDQVSSIGAVAYTDASPTVPEAYPKLANAWQTVATARFLPADLVSMHPRRWAWFLASLDSSNRPLIPAVAGGPLSTTVGQNVIARYDSNAAQGMVGELFGTPIVTTASHATNLGAGTEDQVILARTADMILMESPRRTRILQEVLSGNLTVRLQLYSYVNFFAGRYPGGICRVYDTGFIAPTF